MSKHSSRRGSAAKHRKRHTVAERDGWRCCYCGKPLRCSSPGCDLGYSGAELSTIEHRVSMSRAGTWLNSNLLLACEPCNNIRGSTPWWPLGLPVTRELRAIYDVAINRHGDVPRERRELAWSQLSRACATWRWWHDRSVGRHA